MRTHQNLMKLREEPCSHYNIKSLVSIIKEKTCKAKPTCSQGGEHYYSIA